jgi:hypothetical protein
MYSSVPTSSHSLSKKWKQLIKFYTDLFSMDESKEPDLCNIRVDRIGRTIIFLYSGKGCTFPWGCYMKQNRDDGTVVKNCFLWSKSDQVQFTWCIVCRILYVSLPFMLLFLTIRILDFELKYFCTISLNMRMCLIHIPKAIASSTRPAACAIQLPSSSTYSPIQTLAASSWLS